MTVSTCRAKVSKRAVLCADHCLSATSSSLVAFSRSRTNAAAVPLNVRARTSTATGARRSICPGRSFDGVLPLTSWRMEGIVVVSGQPSGCTVGVAGHGGTVRFRRRGPGIDLQALREHTTCTDECRPEGAASASPIRGMPETSRLQERMQQTTGTTNRADDGAAAGNSRAQRSAQGSRSQAEIAGRNPHAAQVGLQDAAERREGRTFGSAARESAVPGRVSSSIDVLLEHERKPPPRRGFVSSGDRIRTCDLRVMSPTNPGAVRRKPVWLSEIRCYEVP